MPILGGTHHDPVRIWFDDRFEMASAMPPLRPVGILTSFLRDAGVQ